MTKTKTKEAAKTGVDDLWEPLLVGDLNERFYKAVQEDIALYYDVVQTGTAAVNQRKENGFTVSDGHVPYEIVLLHGANVTDDVLARMMALQDRVAAYPYADPDNTIDYKSEEEVIEHYSTGGLGFGVFTVNGDLAGQVMLSFNNEPARNIALDDSGAQADINWLMVDRAYRGNLLCDSLIRLSIRMAESSGMSQISANVRLDNQKGIAKFAANGFVAAGGGQNAKDGSPHIKFYRLVGNDMTIGEEVYPRPLTPNLLQDKENLAKLDMLTEDRAVAKWDFTSKWFTVHSYEVGMPHTPAANKMAKAGF